MKFLLLLTSITYFCLHNVSAQTVKVNYLEEMETITHMNVNGSVQNQSSMIKAEMVLLNRGGESIYRPDIKSVEEKTAITVDGNSGIEIVMAGGDVKIYKNQEDGGVLSEEFIMDRKFLIEESLIDFNWELSNEEQIIAGYSCKKAVSGVTTAWYCEGIPVNDGPYIFWGLPGLILKIEHQNKVVTATEISFIKEDIKIEIPSDGKAVTREKFNEIMSKKMRSMGTPSGQGGVNVNIEIL